MKIIITDDDKRDNLIAEIWHQDKIIAEVNSEKNQLEIEFFDIKGLVINFEEFVELIQNVKNELKFN